MNNKIFDVIYFPSLSEKSYAIMEKENKYFFFVNPRSNKIEIKNAFIALFSVKVESVNTIKRKPKLKKIKKYIGYTNLKKIAIIKLKKGEKLDIFKKQETSKSKKPATTSEKISQKLFNINVDKKTEKK